nr:hypothetical protein [Tanacetum cinerariifolium]
MSLEYEELYKDVNVRLTDTKHEEQGEEDEEITDAGHDDSKGIDLLSDVALLEAAQLKKTLMKSKLETHKLHASGLGDGVGSQPKVLDEQEDKTTGDSGDDESNDDDSDEVTKDDDEDDVESDVDDDKEASDNEKTDSDEDENLNLSQNDDKDPLYNIIEVTDTFRIPNNLPLREVTPFYKTVKPNILCLSSILSS